MGGQGPGGKRLWQRLKPGVSRRVHLFVAPLLWSGVGLWLLARGWGWLGSHRWPLVLLALVLGVIKSSLILDRVVVRTLRRIVQLPEDTCLGAVYSWSSWALVALMMAAGLAIRLWGQPTPALGVVYCAVGWALCWSSRLGWRQWMRQGTHREIV
ncbi:MAG: hypothetical protein ACOX5Z_11285 [Desulfobulbus sp.]|jgi:hypothetical protein